MARTPRSLCSSTIAYVPLFGRVAIYRASLSRSALGPPKSWGVPDILVIRWPGIQDNSLHFLPRPRATAAARRFPISSFISGVTLSLVNRKTPPSLSLRGSGNEPRKGCRPISPIRPQRGRPTQQLSLHQCAGRLPRRGQRRGAAPSRRWPSTAAVRLQDWPAQRQLLRGLPIGPIKAASLYTWHRYGRHARGGRLWCLEDP